MRVNFGGGRREGRDLWSVREACKSLNIYDEDVNGKLWRDKEEKKKKCMLSCMKTVRKGVERGLGNYKCVEREGEGREGEGGEGGTGKVNQHPLIQT